MKNIQMKTIFEFSMLIVLFFFVIILKKALDLVTFSKLSFLPYFFKQLSTVLKSHQIHTAYFQVKTVVCFWLKI